MKLNFKWVVVVLILLLIGICCSIYREIYTESHDNIGGMATFRFGLLRIFFGSNRARQMTVDWLEIQSEVEDAGIGEDGTTIWFEIKGGGIGAILTR